jgi:hypothetical protein
LVRETGFKAFLVNLGFGPGERLGGSYCTRTGAALPSSSPDYDTSPPIDDSAQQAAQQAIDAANLQMMLNSMQAVQQQNDEANAAVTAGILAGQQTEINANNYANNPNN